MLSKDELKGLKEYFRSFPCMKIPEDLFRAIDTALELHDKYNNAVESNITLMEQIEKMKCCGNCAFSKDGEPYWEECNCCKRYDWNCIVDKWTIGID